MPRKRLRTNRTLSPLALPGRSTARGAMDCFRLRQGFGGQVASLVMTKQAANDKTKRQAFARRFCFTRLGAFSVLIESEPGSRFFF
jgi:hypothetical protein